MTTGIHIQFGYKVIAIPHMALWVWYAKMFSNSPFHNFAQLCSMCLNFKHQKSSTDTLCTVWFHASYFCENSQKSNMTFFHTQGVVLTD